MVVQRGGITACVDGGAFHLNNKSRNGEVKATGFQLAKASDEKTDRPVRGRAVKVTDIKVKDNTVVFPLLSTEMASITVKGSTQPTRYRSAIDFEFPEEYFVTATADSVIAGLSKALTLERTMPCGPKTIAPGVTVAELEAALGKPEKVINLGTKTIYVYKDIKVTLVDGKVTDVQ